MKEKLLYLCHRIPFPANKGDKITTCNILKFLSKHYDIYLGCFIDAPFDERYKKDVKAFCKDAYFVPLDTKQAKIRGLSAFLTGKPITLPYYYRAKMQHWVNQTVNQHDIKTAFIYSGCMAQYVLDKQLPHLHNVIHFADIDSDKWRQYSEKNTGIMRWVYKREHHTLEQYEKQVANHFAVSCFISDTETNMFRNMLGRRIDNKIQTLGNGIDCEFFSPTADQHLAENYALKTENYVVFTGAMDYWANVDAVKWFIEHVWKNVHKQFPESKFYIVGSSPTKEVINLQEIPGVIVTGRVEDVRPYLKYAKAAVAPMQIARGIQNKILEAMAMEKPVITTQLGIEGIDNYPDDELYVSDNSEQITNWVLAKLAQSPTEAIASRNWLMETYSWDAKLSPLLDYLRDDYDQ